MENFAEGFRLTFKIQLLQELKPNELPQRKIFGEWALGKLAEDTFLSKNWLNGYVNKQNCRFWSEDLPEELQKQPMRKKSQFGALYRLVASLDRTSSKMLRIVM